MSKEFYFGIDTSAYTTSIAVLDNNGKIVLDLRELLKVEKGKRGLRQQEAVFQHLNNLPKMIKLLTKEIDISKIGVIASSTKPRNINDSYMPVFKVSMNQGYIFSKLLNVPFYEFSHQEGHIASGCMKKDLFNSDEFMALHISGGTTEILLVKNKNNRYDIKVIGGTKDISVGQLVDRIGVELGKSFPCGMELELLSRSGKVFNNSIPAKTKLSWINFSGAETYFKKIIKNRNHREEDIAITLFDYIGEILTEALEEAIKIYDVKDILVVGGVASNKIVRQIISNNLFKRKSKNVFFPEQKFCTDNATGIAYLGYLNSIKI